MLSVHQGQCYDEPTMYNQRFIDPEISNKLMDGIFERLMNHSIPKYEIRREMYRILESMIDQLIRFGDEQVLDKPDPLTLFGSMISLIRRYELFLTENCMPVILLTDERLTGMVTNSLNEHGKIPTDLFTEIPQNHSTRSMYDTSDDDSDSDCSIHAPIHPMILLDED